MSAADPRSLLFGFPPLTTFQCPICKEFYGGEKKPKDLNCGHTACVVCLQELFSGSGRIVCPNCNASCDAQNLKTNEAILRAVEEFRHSGIIVTQHETTMQPQNFTLNNHTPWSAAPVQLPPLNRLSNAPFHSSTGYPGSQQQYPTPTPACDSGFPTQSHPMWFNPWNFQVPPNWQNFYGQHQPLMSMPSIPANSFSNIPTTVTNQPDPTDCETGAHRQVLVEAAPKQLQSHSQRPLRLPNETASVKQRASQFERLERKRLIDELREVKIQLDRERRRTTAINFTPNMLTEQERPCQISKIDEAAEEAIESALLPEKGNEVLQDSEFQSEAKESLVEMVAASNVELLVSQTNESDNKEKVETKEETVSEECEEAKKGKHELNQTPLTMNCLEELSKESGAPVPPQTKLRPLTILLLGETGCGKSTFVNAVGSYIRSENVDEAFSKEPFTYIPCNFHIAGEDGEEQRIQVGESPDENVATGESATRSCLVYTFTTDKYRMHLIDTPGINDTSGTEKDKENLNLIMATLARFPTLNAICLLMKSDHARLTQSVRYCLSELLMRLHRDAVHNICFVFTHSRGSFYRPGESKATLRVFLERLNEDNHIGVATEKENTFCMDNEAFCLLVAMHRGVILSPPQLRALAESWTHSSKTFFNLLDFAANRSPHAVAMTRNLNDVRQIVLHMAKPMADVTLLIQDNMALAQRHKADIENTREELEALQLKLKRPQERIHVEELQYPRTVCTSTKCVERQHMETSGIVQTIYKTVCCERCYLSRATKDVFPEPALQSCKAMDWTKRKCKRCGCSWQLHMHLTFSQTKAIEMIDDDAVSQAIADNQSAAEVKQTMIAKTELRIKELEKEQQIICDCSAHFAHFLKINAIMPFSDVFEEHAKRNIEEERESVTRGGDSEPLRGLEEVLRRYREKREELEQATADAVACNDAIGDTTEITEKFELLKRLKHAGKELKQLFRQMKRGEELQAQADVVQMKSRWESPVGESTWRRRSHVRHRPSHTPSLMDAFF